MADISSDGVWEISILCLARSECDFGRKTPWVSYSSVSVSAAVSALACVDLSLIGLAWVVAVFGVPCVLALCKGGGEKCGFGSPVLGPVSMCRAAQLGVSSSRTGRRCGGVVGGVLDTLLEELALVVMTGV